MVAQGSCGFPIPRNAQSQVGRGFEQSDLVKDVSGLELDGLQRILLNPKPFYDSTAK